MIFIIHKQEASTKERRQTAFVLLCCSIISLFLQVFKFNIFPPKYFYDTNVVLRLMTDTIAVNFQNSYATTAIVFQWMNQWFPMDSQLYGGLVLWALFILPTLWIAICYMKPTWEHYILFAAYTVLLPIFVWNVQKEAMQYAFFLLLLGVASRKTENNVVDALLVILLLIWSILFRSYYLIVAAATAFFLILAKMPWQKWTCETKQHVVVGLALVMFGCLIFMYIFWPDGVHQLFNGRMSVNAYRDADPDANTIILDLVQNKNRRLFLYLLNYFFASVRMMIPLELIFKGLQYWPFVLMQIFWTALILTALKKLLLGKCSNVPQKRFLCITLSWYLVSFLFEPDFGSFVRHQTGVYPVLFPMMLYTLE